MPITPFMKMFGQSPFKLLQHHMDIAFSAVNELRPFVKTIMRQDWDAAGQMRMNIAALENKADTIKKEVRTHLPKSLFLPVSRGDILALLSAQDQVANLAKDIAGLMLGRKMLIPASMQNLFDALLEKSSLACLQAKKIINELDELLECGFRGNEMHVVESMIDELDKIERETDEIQVNLRQTLFELEKQLPPIDVMFLYKVIESIGGLADFAHGVGGKLQVLLAR